MVNAGIVKTRLDQAKAFMAYRKNLGSLPILGIGFVIKFIWDSNHRRIGKRVSDLFGIKARAVISTYPEIGTDVDKDSDLRLAARVLS